MKNYKIRVRSFRGVILLRELKVSFQEDAAREISIQEFPRNYFRNVESRNRV